jgi:hypothetical protein
MIPIAIEDIPQDERRRVLKEGELARKASTYFQQASANIEDERGGRWAKHVKTVVAGSDPSVAVPRQPSSSPSNQMAMMPPEPVLGYSVEDHEACGEYWEIQASLKSQGASSSAMAAPKTDDGVSTSPPISARVGARRRSFRRRL